MSHEVKMNIDEAANMAEDIKREARLREVAQTIESQVNELKLKIFKGGPHQWGICA